MYRSSCVLILAATVLLACLPSRSQNIPGSPSSSTVQADSRQRPLDPAPEFHERNPRYILRTSDSFDISFTFSPEFNQTVVVEPDGFVTFRGAGSAHVAGETLPELTETIKKAYIGILHDPSVTVALKDFEHPYFIAAGQVAKPGKYDLRGNISLTEAVNVAGGFTESSKHSQVLLFRHVGDDKVEARIFDVKKMLASRDLAEDPQLQPGDMLFVPQNAISKIRKYLPTSSMGLYANPLAP
jgi:polysaccharide biosynthesis/export protein